MTKHSPTILSVGAGVQDVLLSGRIFASHLEAGEDVEEFLVGEKYEVERVTFSSGGGATNAAVTFARQGLNAVFLGKVGDDPAGRIVLDDLRAEAVAVDRVKIVNDVNTGYSTILLDPDGGRTVLVYRGASASFAPDDFHLDGLQADWVYITSLAGSLESIRKVVAAAKEMNAKIGINPGKKELEQPEELKQILHQVDLLTLNKEEIQLLVDGDSDEALVRHASDMAPITIMTDGPRGVVATDRQQVVKAGMYEDVPVVDRLGAGDAFGSGFTASIVKGRSLADAVRWASANSTSVVSQIGAKPGILHESAELHDMPMEVSDF